MPDLILHHYDTSPYAEKARLVFGLKGLAWKSVDIPLIMPKPDLVPLTGGYRRTPVLQVGADIYCDTELIAAEVERRHPQPTLYPPGSRALAGVISTWVSAALFPAAVGYAFSSNAERMPPGLLDDRHAMWGTGPADLERIKRAAPRHLYKLQALLPLVNDGLADGRPFFTGAHPGLVDVSIYHSLWFLARNGRRVAACLEPFPHTKAWMARVAAIGHGTRTELHAHEALKVAHGAEPTGGEVVEADNAVELKAGDIVHVTAEDFGRDPVEGRLVGLTVERITVRRHDPRTGDVAVHFPRVGYQVRKV